MCACVRIHVQAYIVHQTLHSFHLKIVLCSFFIDFFFGFFFASQNDIDYKENCHNSYSFIKMIYSLLTICILLLIFVFDVHIINDKKKKSNFVYLFRCSVNLLIQKNIFFCCKSKIDEI